MCDLGSWGPPYAVSVTEQSKYKYREQFISIQSGFQDRLWLLPESEHINRMIQMWLPDRHIHGDHSTGRKSFTVA